MYIQCILKLKGTCDLRFRPAGPQVFPCNFIIYPINCCFLLNCSRCVNKRERGSVVLEVVHSMQSVNFLESTYL